MITAFISIKREGTHNNYVVKFIPLSCPDDEVDCIVEMMQSRYGKANVKVKRGEELQKSIEANRKQYDEMAKIIEDIIS